MAKLTINNESFQINNIFDTPVTVPDCFVVNNNKIGKGHGEAKFYLSSKERSYKFFGGSGYKVKCFVLKQDIINYMNAIKGEYFNPSQDYRGKDNMSDLWEQREEKVAKMNDIIEFTICDQDQIAGDRGYVNVLKDDQEGYKLIREVSLPLISYIQVMQLRDNTGSSIYYWKLFADFDAILERKSVGLVFKYGKKIKNKESKTTQKSENIRLSRVGQGLFRSNLLGECPFCPITTVADERLLIASHIKPWAVSDDKERIDAKNGFILSPVYDKLFDRGFITFTNEKKLIVSNWVNPSDFKKLNVEANKFYQFLPIDDERKVYLDYHRNSVFKG